MLNFKICPVKHPNTSTNSIEPWGVNESVSSWSDIVGNVITTFISFQPSFSYGQNINVSVYNMSLICNDLLLMDLALRRQKSNVFSFERFCGCRFTCPKLFKLGPKVVDFQVANLREFQISLILKRRSDCFKNLPARVRRFRRIP